MTNRKKPVGLSAHAQEVPLSVRASQQVLEMYPVKSFVRIEDRARAESCWVAGFKQALRDTQRKKGKG